MKGRRQWFFVGMLAIGVVACVGTSHVESNTATTGDPVIGLLSKGITQLNANINALSKRMNDVKQMSTGTDPTLRELQALDLSGWQLHQQQWVLQRDHLVLARDSLQRAFGQPEQKQQLLDQWRQHQQQYVKALEELRQQRQSLENKHLEVEAGLIEHGLQ
jgi:chromosome segregation ATPase